MRMSKALCEQNIARGNQALRWMREHCTLLQSPGIVTHPTGADLKQSFNAARDKFRAQPVGSVMVAVIRIPDFPRSTYYQVFEVLGAVRASTRLFELVSILRVNEKSTSRKYGDLKNPLRADAFTMRCHYKLGRFHTTGHPEHSVNVAEVWRLDDDIAKLVLDEDIISGHAMWKQQRKDRHEARLSFRLIYEPLCECSTRNGAQPIASLNLSLFRLIENYL